MFGFFRRIIFSISILFFAALFSLIPSFMDQYVSQIYSRQQELRIILQASQTIAEHSHQTLEQHIELFRQNSDPAVQAHGELLKTIYHREKNFNSFLSLWNSKTFSEKFLKSWYYLDEEVFLSAKENFSPSISANYYTLIFLCLGASLGAVFAWIILALIARIFRKIQELFL